MTNVSKIISIYAADTSGVCSALYELGGMTVVHDASGCNSTYSTHDEPRWYDKNSMIYISALTETDAIMGNDQKLIDDICSAAKELAPAFIALCGSPMPAMTGTDMNFAAEEIALVTGIKTFAINTNGTHSYLYGAGQAFAKIAGNFCTERKKTDKMSVNILGATPLDFSLNGSIESIKKWLCENGFSVKTCFAMGSDLSEISHAPEAQVNLVISSSGIPTAKYFYDRFGIPFVTGVPIGKSFSETLAQNLKTAVKTGKCLFPASERISSDNGFIVTGESVYASSLAAAVTKDLSMPVKVLSTVSDSDDRTLAKGDIICRSEDELEREFEKASLVIADPLFSPICPKGRFSALPHEAFSGRCFSKSIPNLINADISGLLTQGG